MYICILLDIVVPRSFVFFFFLMIRRPPISPLFPSTTLSRSIHDNRCTRYLVPVDLVAQRGPPSVGGPHDRARAHGRLRSRSCTKPPAPPSRPSAATAVACSGPRSEERRGGEEGRTRWSADPYNKK